MTAAERLHKLALAVIVCRLVAYPVSALAQTPTNQEPKESDVVRVYTELVQTDVMVFNKQGDFVNGLRREDFELLIDGRARPIEFFERIAAGSANEEAQLTAARGAPARADSPTTGPVPLDRGRTLFFYLDDLHLDNSAVALARKMVTHFIDNQMGQNDEAAIACASGQIGFLQQLTDNKTVLRTALDRLKPRTTRVTDFQRPAMSEYQALLVSRYDRDVTDVYVEALLREMPGLNRATAESMVRERAQQALLQAANITRVTLNGIESLVRSSAKLPGRKVVFFVSNGFLLDESNSDTFERLHKITSAAARSGVVIYSMDARGLVASLNDATTESTFDVTGRLERASHGEIFAAQDGLNALARDTGGRPLFNTNALEFGLKKALQESSTYYLLAWKPESGTQPNGKFRKIEVRLVNRRDLNVRVRSGFYDFEPTPETARANNKKDSSNLKAPEAVLAETITSVFPDRSIPLSLTLSHVNTAEKGDLLSASMQFPGEFLSFRPVGEKRKAEVDVIGTVFDDRGRIGARFGDRLTMTVDPAQLAGNGGRAGRELNVNYSYPVYIKPGLYHVRVAARDSASGRVGSAHGWIEIPDLSTGQLSMSTVLVGERQSTNLTNASTTDSSLTDQIKLSVDRRFQRDSYLRFLVFVYNAAREPLNAKPDAAVQVQLLRDDQPVVTTALRRVDSEGISDLGRLPYAAEIPLTALPTGRYLLSVTVVDRISKRSSSQQTRFEIY